MYYISAGSKENVVCTLTGDFSPEEAAAVCAIFQKYSDDGKEDFTKYMEHIKEVVKGELYFAAILDNEKREFIPLIINMKGE